MIDWMPVTIVQGRDTLLLHMSKDALRRDGIRWAYAPNEIAALCEEYDAIAPTPYLLDQRYLQAIHQNSPSPKFYAGGLGMNTTDAIVAHSRRIDAQLSTTAGSDPDDDIGSIGNVGKHWVYPLEREQLYGWHVMTHEPYWKGIRLYDSVISGGLKVIQRPSLAHTGRDPDKIEATHRDYSMTAVLVHRVGWLNSAEIDVRSLFEARSQLVFGPWIKPLRGYTRTRQGDRGPLAHAGQTMLRAECLDPGPIDGIHGRKTEAAWQAYEARAAGAAITPISVSFKQATSYSKGRPFGPANVIVLHTAETIEHEASAERLQAWAASSDCKVSWHDAIDNDSIASSVLAVDRAHAAGPLNDRGYNIELAGYARQTAKDWDDAFSRAQMVLLVKRVKQRCTELNIPKRRLTADQLYEGHAGICDHRTVSQASRLAEQRDIKMNPWWHPIRKAWRIQTHQDVGDLFPWEVFLNGIV